MDFSTIEITSKKQTNVGTTSTFQSPKLHQKSTWKWRRDSSKFGLPRIDVQSTLYRRQFDVEHQLGPISWVELNVLNFFPCWTLLLLILFLISSLFFVRTFCLHYDSDFRLDFISDSNLNATISKVPVVIRRGFNVDATSHGIVQCGIDFETILCV